MPNSLHAQPITLPRLKRAFIRLVLDSDLEAGTAGFLGGHYRYRNQCEGEQEEELRDRADGSHVVCDIAVSKSEYCFGGWTRSLAATWSDDSCLSGLTLGFFVAVAFRVPISIGLRRTGDTFENA